MLLLSKSQACRQTNHGEDEEGRAKIATEVICRALANVLFVLFDGVRFTMYVTVLSASTAAVMNLNDERSACNETRGTTDVRSILPPEKFQ